VSRQGTTGAPAIAAPIAFGTSGWRGISGSDFNLPRVRIAAGAVAAWLRETGAAGEVVVAHDSRPGGEEFADATSLILRTHGFAVARARSVTPTPAVTRAVLARAAAAAVVFTASHNPPEYAGMKVFGPEGGSLESRHTQRIEALAAAGVHASGSRVSGDGSAAPEHEVDLISAYVRDLLGEIDGEAMARAGHRVVYDAMHGAGAGVLDRALGECGLAPRVLRGAPDPLFGGVAPDPTPERLTALVHAVRSTDGPVLGLATDGDADRFAVVDGNGRVLSETEAMALLVDHLARTGRIEGGVALSIATGTLVERVAESHGLRVERHPIGFKHLARALMGGGVDAAGEESGGFALGRFGRDKDGMLAGCFFAEMLAMDPTPLAARLTALAERHGPRLCGRRALAGSDDERGVFAKLLAEPPEHVDGVRVERVRRGDGLHLALEDGFLMLRASGTEPLLRIYAEAPSAEALERRFAAGRSLLAG